MSYHPLIKNFMLILGIYSGLTWLYCVVRIYTGNFPFSEEFIMGIPVTFLHLSILSFIVSATAMFQYLILRESEKL